MNRITFLTLYVLGILAMLVAGNPWSRVNHLLLQPSKASLALTASFWVALLVPIVLIVVAAIRGPSIGKPRLFLWPLAAFLVSTLAFVYGWLSRAMAGGEPSASGVLPMSIAISLGFVVAFAPLLIHVACCVIGSNQKTTKTIPASRAG